MEKAAFFVFPDIQRIGVAQVIDEGHGYQVYIEYQAEDDAGVDITHYLSKLEPAAYNSIAGGGMARPITAITKPTTEGQILLKMKDSISSPMVITSRFL